MLQFYLLSTKKEKIDRESILAYKSSLLNGIRVTLITLLIVLCILLNIFTTKMNGVCVFAPWTVGLAIFIDLGISITCLCLFVRNILAVSFLFCFLSYFIMLLFSFSLQLHKQMNSEDSSNSQRKDILLYLVSKQTYLFLIAILSTFVTGIFGSIITNLALLFSSFDIFINALLVCLFVTFKVFAYMYICLLTNRCVVLMFKFYNPFFEKYCSSSMGFLLSCVICMPLHVFASVQRDIRHVSQLSIN